MNTGQPLVAAPLLCFRQYSIPVTGANTINNTSLLVATTEKNIISVILFACFHTFSITVLKN